VGLKIEIHEIHKNLRNPASINQNPPSAMKNPLLYSSGFFESEN